MSVSSLLQCKIVDVFNDFINVGCAVLLCAGLSSPPANITTSAVPSIVTPIVNGFTSIPHQPNGHPAVEAVYTNGLSPYSTQSPTAADTLQQAFTGVQQYTG